MTILTDPPKESFRLSMLLYDTRYRSATIQVVAMLAFMLLAAWLINNTMVNLNAADKNVSFGFLGEAAGYDINQRLLEYDNRDSHTRAALVGLSNTLLVAFLGCITATIIGVFVGVMRLSNNWLVARIMTVYVETFRNVPVLLWIVLALAVLSESLPLVKSFRGDDPETTMSLFGMLAWSNRGVFIARPMMTSLGWLVPLVFILSIFVVRWLSKRADRIQEQSGDRPKMLLTNLGTLVLPAVVTFFLVSQVTKQNDYVFVSAGVESPASLAAFADETRVSYCHASGRAGSLQALSYLESQEITAKRRNYFSNSASATAVVNGKCNLLAVPASDAEAVVADLSGRVKAGTPVSIIPETFKEGAAIQIEAPEITPKGIARFEGGTHIRNSLLALWLALSLYTAAFIAEIVRSGILAISTGQSEAASALGLRSGKTMRLVILPQALRVIIPPMISNYLNLTKNSSLAIAVGYMDITGTLGGITMNQTGRELECVLMLMAVYLTISLCISVVMNWYNNSVKLVER